MTPPDICSAQQALSTEAAGIQPAAELEPTPTATVGAVVLTHEMLGDHTLDLNPKDAGRVALQTVFG